MKSSVFIFKILCIFQSSIFTKANLQTSRKPGYPPNYFDFIVASKIYSESMESKRDIGADGLRSSKGFRIYRINSDSILPFIPLVRKVACIDHCAARVTETLINLTLETVVSKKDEASEDILAGVDILCRNLAA